MKRIFINEVSKQADEEVMLEGFAEVIRDQKAVQFVILRDRSGKVQLVNDRSVNPGVADVISKITVESTINVVGTVVTNDKVKLGGVEIVIKSLEVTSQAEAELPIPVTGPEPSLENSMDYRWLDLRRPEKLLIFKVQTTMEHAMREFWNREGYLEIHSPKLLNTASESGAELFTVENYFGRKAYLAQSPQFYKQMAMAAGFEKVFEIGPVFRAEPSFTSRHATEYTSIDMEMSWIKDHFDVMAEEERWIQYVIKRIQEIHGEEIEKLFGVKIDIPEIPFPKITMVEAQKIVNDSGHKIDASTKGDLDPEGERIIGRHFKEKTGHDFVFVTDYPKSVRPFYHMRHEDDPNLTKSFDLLGHGIEITTGAQREHRYEILAKQAEEKGVSLEPLKFYLDFFKYGCPPHGGLGFGLSRMLMVLLNKNNIREVDFIYRGPNRLTP